MPNGMAILLGLYKLAPQNQYILATHSEEMFRSVDEDYRAVLMPDEDNGIPS